MGAERARVRVRIRFKVRVTIRVGVGFGVRVTGDDKHYIRQPLGGRRGRRGVRIGSRLESR